MAERKASIDKFFLVKRKEVEVDDWQYNYLGKVAELLEIVEHNRNFWRYTTAKLTLQKLAIVEATLNRLSEAIKVCLESFPRLFILSKANDFRLERFAAAVFKKGLDKYPSAIRCPATKSAQVRKGVKDARLALKNGLLALLHGLYELCEASTVDKYQHFINIDKKTLMENIKQEEDAVVAADVDEDFVDEGVKIEIDEPEERDAPLGMYQ